MEYRTLHPWSMGPDEARALQERLRHMVALHDDFPHVTAVAGIDMSIDVENERGHAAVIVLSFPGFELIEARYATGPLLMPYIPGLLSFREAPIVLQAVAQVRHDPDLIMVDGQGIAHPRRFGIASHLGVLLDIPAIGVAKSRLYGAYDHAALPDEPGAETPLHDPANHTLIGAVVRTKKRSGPLFVSPGHRVSVASAKRFVLESLRGYRLPEPTRIAHNLITEYKKIVGRTPV
jgi:deoxyribonuclease V